MRHARLTAHRPFAQFFRHEANMKHASFLRHFLRIATIAVALFTSSAFADTTPAAPQNSADDLSDIRPDSAPSATGNVTELQDLLKAGSLTELRSTRNGSYGARLYFLPREMVYYVALSQETQLWRVMKSQDENRAESVYAQFARKSFDLADGEIRRARLQAQTALLDRVIAVSANRANRLSADIALAQQQDAQVSERQQKLLAESSVLASDKAEAERKLRVLQQQVDQLQRQSEAGLSPVPVVRTPVR
jgi:hypothetical protein